MNLRQLLRAIKPSGGKVVIKHKHPNRVESLYREALRKDMAAMAAAVRDEIFPLVKAELRGARVDSKVDVLRAINDIAKRSFGEAALAKRISDSLAKHKDEEIVSAVGRAVGVNITPPGSDTAEIVDLWVEQNTSLITDMETKYLNKVRQAVGDGFKNGWSARDIAKQINEATGMGMRRAKNIARDQIGTLNASLNQKRDEELGIDEYIWRTMGDEKVRGAPQNGIGGKYPKAIPSHVAREGQRYSYKNPPAGGNPGEDYMCRCYPEAVIEF